MIRLVQFLVERAEKLGVEVYHGYSARDLIVEDGVVRGVRLAEVGLAHDGSPKGNHIAAEEIRAPITILADGTHGVLSTQFAERFGGGANPQAFSLGIKAIVQFPDKSPFGAGRVMHTLGYPNPQSVFGGGFMYAMGEKTVACGLIMGLDWKYGDLNPQREFETWRAHPFISRLLKGGVTVATGAKTIPEGGFFSMTSLSAPGAMVIGDGAGFVNMEKIKGIHYGIYSGMAAAETAVEALASGEAGALAGDAGATGSLDGYRARLETRGVLADLRHARNYRQAFRWGLFVGTPLSLVQSKLPRRLGMHRDGPATKRGARLNRPDPGRMDGATFVALTGALHREDEPSHITILDAQQCLACEAAYANACTNFCPGQVYRWNGSRDRALALELPPLHDVHGEVPDREHPLGAARGRRGTALQADVAIRPRCRRVATPAERGLRSRLGRRSRTRARLARREPGTRRTSARARGAAPRGGRRRASTRAHRPRFASTRPSGPGRRRRARSRSPGSRAARPRGPPSRRPSPRSRRRRASSPT